MAVPINAIGAEFFLEFLGVPDWIKQRMELNERPGVNGTGIWDTGFRGRPFSMRTRVDTYTLGDAWDAYNRYCLLTDANPQPIVFRGMALAGWVWQGDWHNGSPVATGVWFQVLDVRAVDIGENANFSGGLNYPSLGWCECEWDLLPVPSS